MGVIAASIAFSALAGNHVALLIIHALAATALEIAIPSAVGGVGSGVLAYHGFFPKKTETSVDDDLILTHKLTDL